MRANLIRLSAGVIVIIAIAGTASYFIFNKKEEVSISDSANALVVKVDFDKYDNLLTPEQQARLQLDLIKATTNKNTSGSEIKGTIRSSSVKRTPAGETLFVIDAPALETSYLISRYVSAKESVDIINISCVPDDQKVYSKDYCYEE